MKGLRKRVEAKPQEFYFCERVTATPTSRIHIRRIGTDEGPKFGGGIDGPTLCGANVLRGWDLPGKVSPAGMRLDAECGPTCPHCAYIWSVETGVQL